MFIDLHCHTKNAKKSETHREVDSATFLRTMQAHGVGIVAITNHNLFCKSQYDEFAKLDENLMVWPGVELDVIGNKSPHEVRGHVIVISNPKHIDTFDRIISTEVSKDTPDNYCINIDDLISLLNQLDECLIICHYYKSPGLTKEDLAFLKSSISDDKIVMLEPSNSRKAALLIYDDEEQSWFGSDVLDWNHYPNDKPDFKLPECKFDIKSFESFYFLLKKNRSAVLSEGYLDPKKSDLVHLNVFGDLSFDYQVFNDVNIIFGGKATAKTSILKKLENYFLSKSKNVATYYVESKADDLKRLVNKKPSDSIISHFQEYSSKDDFEYFKKWKWPEIPVLKLFYRSEVSSQNNAIVAKLKITKAVFSETISKEAFINARKDYLLNRKRIDEFLKIGYKEFLSDVDIDQLNTLVGKILGGITSKYHRVAVDYFSKCLEEWTIEKLKKRISSASSTIAKPSSPGLSSFFVCYRELKNHLNNLKNNLGQQKDVYPRPIIGSIPFKGNVYRKVLIGFPAQPQSENRNIIGGDRNFLSGQTKQNYDAIVKAIKNIKIGESTDLISKAIEDFVSKTKECQVGSLCDFLNYSTFLATDTNEDFLPSNGVTSILLVNGALQNDDADVIILDEPDGGMGADFINNDLISKINNRARENKIIIIATHDPNLVVRTHPYSCLYREEVSNEVYRTYIGSSFDEELVDILNDDNRKRWIDACVEKCEGGDRALNERIMTYGK